MIDWQFVADNGGIEPRAELVEAYAKVFDLRSADVQTVLADLAAKTGYFRVSGPDATPNEILFQEGMRAAFAVILDHVSLSPADKANIINAARQAAAEI